MLMIPRQMWITSTIRMTRVAILCMISHFFPRRFEKTWLISVMRAAQTSITPRTNIATGRCPNSLHARIE